MIHIVDIFPFILALFSHTISKTLLGFFSLNFFYVKDHIEVLLLEWTRPCESKIDINDVYQLPNHNRVLLNLKSRDEIVFR